MVSPHHLTAPPSSLLPVTPCAVTVHPLPSQHAQPTMETADRHREEESTRLSSRRSPIHEAQRLDESASSDSAASSFSDGPPSNEGYDIDLFESTDEKNICPICMMILRDPLQTACGHRFCDRCIRRWLREDLHSRCPVCNELCPVKQLFPDNYAKREIMALMAKCPNHKMGCSVIIELGKIERHLGECTYLSVPCTNGCGENVLQADIQHHLLETCSMRLVVCKHCRANVKFTKMQNHNDECLEKLIQCKYCSKTFQRKDMGVHVGLSCTNAIIPCSYSKYGCTHTCNRSELDDHLQSQTAQHLDLFIQCVERSGLVKFYDVTRSGPFRATLSSHISAATQGYVTDAGFCSGTTSVFSTAHSYTAPDDVTEPLLTQYPRVTFPISSPLSPQGSHLSCSDPIIHAGTFPLALEHARAELRAKDRETISKLRSKVDIQSCQITDQTLKIQEHQNSIHRLETQLRDFEGRNCKGEYIWKVVDYSRRKRDALAGKSVVHHSPGFYTSFYGYKLCVRVNLNGVESGTGSHLSLFVHLMQGEYDDILRWPFQGRITLKILDQRDTVESKSDITEVLIAKPGLAAFLRPTSKRNHKGFGYIEFAPLEFVENGNYIKNDVMIVKVIVKHEE